MKKIVTILLLMIVVAIVYMSLSGEKINTREPVAPTHSDDIQKHENIKSDTKPFVNEDLVGKWQLTDDPINDPIEGMTFFREFHNNGSYNDILENIDTSGDSHKTIISGKWKIFIKRDILPPEENGTYLELSTEDNSNEDKKRLKIIKITPEILELNLIENDITSIYVKVK